MAYKVWIENDQLITLLQDHYNDKIYENIKENDQITQVRITYQGIEITIGYEE